MKLKKEIKLPPKAQKKQWNLLKKFYKDHLLNDVMPFWMKLIDSKYGGIFNAVTDNGEIISKDKFTWSQGRALWTFSALYNNQLNGTAQWLDIADGIADFLIKHGRDKDGAWLYCLKRDGTVMLPAESIYADAFVICGLTEYAKATGNSRALDVAIEGFKRTSPLLDDHSKLLTRPHPIPKGTQANGPSMLFASIYHDLGVLADNKEIKARALELAEIVMTQHLKPEHKLLYEFVASGGKIIDSDVGKTFLVGHAIESMWFMHEIYSHYKWWERVDLAMQAVKWHIERGWDDKYGGVFLAQHTDGGTPIWWAHDVKCWWVTTEILIGLLFAYERTGQTWPLEWLDKVNEYTFKTFPNPEHGDWHQNLDRKGNPIPVVVKALPVKDLFHLPRSLIYCTKILDRFSQRDNK